jgi:hypothetical protein
MIMKHTGMAAILLFVSSQLFRVAEVSFRVFIPCSARANSENFGELQLMRDEGLKPLQP